MLTLACSLRRRTCWVARNGGRKGSRCSTRSRDRSVLRLCEHWPTLTSSPLRHPRTASRVRKILCRVRLLHSDQDARRRATSRVFSSPGGRDSREVRFRRARTDWCRPRGRLHWCRDLHPDGTLPCEARRNLRSGASRSLRLTVVGTSRSRPTSLIQVGMGVDSINIPISTLLNKELTVKGSFR
jgi:hypothetical protein